VHDYDEDEGTVDTRTLNLRILQEALETSAQQHIEEALQMVEEEAREQVDDESQDKQDQTNIDI
jgi:hypothetical protein